MRAAHDLDPLILSRGSRLSSEQLGERIRADTPAHPGGAEHLFRGDAVDAIFVLAHLTSLRRGTPSIPVSRSARRPGQARRPVVHGSSSTIGRAPVEAGVRSDAATARVVAQAL